MPLKIFFTASAKNYQQMRPTYLTINDIIKRLGGVQTWNFTQSVDEKIKNNIRDISKKQWLELYKKMHKALTSSDLVILENSVSAFSTGYLAGIAISNKIPTLTLVKKHITGTFNTSFIEGINSPYFTTAYYNSNNDLYKIIKNFMETYKQTLKLEHFHLKLTPKEKLFIKRLAKELNTSKIDAIRKLINDAIINQDS